MALPSSSSGVTSFDAGELDRAPGDDRHLREHRLCVGQAHLVDPRGADPGEGAREVLRAQVARRRTPGTGRAGAPRRRTRAAGTRIAHTITIHLRRRRTRRYVESDVDSCLECSKLCIPFPLERPNDGERTLSVAVSAHPYNTSSCRPCPARNQRSTRVDGRQLGAATTWRGPSRPGLRVTPNEACASPVWGVWRPLGRP